MSNPVRYICQFCGNATKYIYSHHTIPEDTFKCFKCDTYFIADRTGKLNQMSMNCSLKEKKYQLQMWYIHNMTRIIILPDNKEDTIIIVAEFPGTLSKVNPKNISNKIETYITFS